MHRRDQNNEPTDSSEKTLPTTLMEETFLATLGLGT